MNVEQRKFIDEVILPKLVDMACNDELPMDMGELSSYHFDAEAKEYNSSEAVIIRSAIESAGHYLGEYDNYSIAEQIELIKDVAWKDWQTDSHTLIDDITNVGVWEAVEYTFSARNFLHDIGYPIIYPPRN